MLRLGEEAGTPLVEHEDVDTTLLVPPGRSPIAETAGRRLAKVSLELGGKNPLVVCDDDLNNVVKWTCLSAFSNAGNAVHRVVELLFLNQFIRTKRLLATKSYLLVPMIEMTLAQ